MMNLACRLVAVVMAIACVARGQQIDAGWTIVAGSDPLEQTAAADLKKLLDSERHVALHGPEVPGKMITGPRIVLGTPESNALVAAEHKARPFRIDPKQPEAYHLTTRGGSVWVVGSTGKGVMNGAFRLLDRPTLDINDLDEAKSPAFRDRVGGHKVNQTPPADWLEEDQARYYARHYVNVVWGEKKDPPLSLAVRQKYGLRLMAEVKSPPFINKSRAWMDELKNASAVYYHKPGETRRVVDPFDPAGKQAYLDAFRETLRDNPDTRILYTIFGDYSVIPSPNSVRISDGNPYAHSRVEGMKQIMSIMREAVGDRDVACVAWLWHGFFGEPAGTEDAFMQWLKDNGYGMLYNEAGNNDNWLIRRDNFNETALKSDAAGKSIWGPTYYPLVSAGGACESVNPVIGMPLPAVAAHKIKRLYDAGVNNIVLWWGSAEGWVYQPNIEVLAEMTWDPQAFADGPDPLNPEKPDALLAKVAQKGFGTEHAKDVLRYWQAFDRALVTEGNLYQPVDKQAAPDQDGLHINDWYQRMGIFTETVFSQEFARPLTPDALSENKAARKGIYWGTSDKNLANYKCVTDRLAQAQSLLADLRKHPLPESAATNAKQMYDWAELYRTLLNSQMNYLRALRAVHGRADEPVKPEQVRDRLRPVIEDELANIDRMIAVLEQLPANANIRQPHEGVVSNAGSTKQEIASLRDKATAMRFVDQDLPNLALNRPTTASSIKTEKGQTFEARFATDGDASTRWASNFGDAQWLAIDLGSVRAVQFVRISWKNAYPSDYEIEVSDEATPATWRSVYRTANSGGGVSVIALPEAVQVRHIRMRASKQATAWGYSVEEFQIFGR